MKPDGGAFGTADDCPREMERRHALGSAWKDEAGERLEPPVHLIDLLFEAVDLGCDYPQRSVDVAWGRDIGAQVKKVVLDSGQPPFELAVIERCNRKADRRIGFVDFADRIQPQARPADPAAVDQPATAAVA